MRLGVAAGAGVLLLALAAGCRAHARDDGSRVRRLGAPAAPFVEVLSPHGTWLDVEPFGKVWRPHEHVVGAHFLPYASRGRWAWAPVGWVFLSDWSWGWATFHYGHWLFDPSRGWLWVPGTQWAPAWVDWRYGGGLVGWAPTPPPFYGDWYAGWPGRWCFAPARHFIMPDVAQHLVARHLHPRSHAVTQPLPRYPVRGGPAWPVGPTPTDLLAPGGGRLPTVTLRPPAAGHVERVALGPIVERPPGALGVETGPRAGRDSAPSKPGAWVVPEPREEERARAPAPTAPPPDAQPAASPGQAPPPRPRTDWPSPREQRERAKDLPSDDVLSGSDPPAARHGAAEPSAEPVPGSERASPAAPPPAAAAAPRDDVPSAAERHVRPPGGRDEH